MGNNNLEKLKKLEGQHVSATMQIENIYLPRNKKIIDYVAFTATNFEDKTKTYDCIGYIPELSEGEIVEVSGIYKIYYPKTSIQRYSKPRLQIEIQDYEIKNFDTEEDIVKYLVGLHIKDIGVKRAQNIVKDFGTNTLKVIDHYSDALKNVKGVKEKTYESLAAYIRKRREIRSAIAYAKSLGFGKANYIKIAERFGTETEDVVMTNPYRIATEIPDISFQTIDDLMVKENKKITEDSTERIASGILYQMNLDCIEGNLFSYIDELKAPLCRLLNLKKSKNGDLSAKFNEAVQYLGQKGKIYNGAVNGRNVLYLKKYCRIENRIAKHLKRIASNVMPYTCDDIMFGYGAAHISDEQRTAVENVFHNSLSIITGGPGTGKSHVTQFIINNCESLKLKYMAIAPTGRAAKRLEQSISANGVISYSVDKTDPQALKDLADKQPKTIHRALGIMGKNGEFAKNENNPLDADVIIIDEASMIDINLAYALLSAIGNSTRVVFIGDSDQLPSIGPGSFFGDMINSGCFPVTRLTKVYRQGENSIIVENSRRINRGEFPICSSNFDMPDDNFFFVNTNGFDCVDKVTDIVTNILPHKFGLDPEKDIQVLTPYRRSENGTENMNTALKEIINPKKEDVDDFNCSSGSFRIGDKVMQMRNNYQLGIFNGDIGYITNIDFDHDTVTVEFDDYRNHVIEYSKRELFDLSLAYATTIHKAQGSEVPAAVIVFSGNNDLLLSRNLLYTAVTRAKRVVVLVGDRSAFQKAVDSVKLKNRNTELGFILEGSPHSD